MKHRYTFFYHPNIFSSYLSCLPHVIDQGCWRRDLVVTSIRGISCVILLYLMISYLDIIFESDSFINKKKNTCLLNFKSCVPFPNFKNYKKTEIFFKHCSKITNIHFVIFIRFYSF